MKLKKRSTIARADFRYYGCTIIGNKKFYFIREHFDLDKFFATIKSDFSIMVSQKRITLTVKSEFPRSIFCDKNQIRQVLNNLIKNAVSFVPEETGKIEVKVEKDEYRILFSVRDNGIGIPKK